MTTNHLLVPRKTALQEAFSQAQHFHQLLHGKLRSQGIDEETARKVAQSFTGHVVLSKSAADGLVRDDMANLLAIENWGNRIVYEMIWHWPTASGSLTSGVSDSRHVGTACSLRLTVIDVSTFSTNFTIRVFKNGLFIQTCNVTKAGVGQKFPILPPVPLAAYTDLITINAITPGTGNQGIVVTAEAW